MSDAYIEIRINRNTAIAVLVSLLLHVLMLYLLSREDLFNQHQPASSQQPITVQLAPRVAARPAEAAPAASPPPARPAPPPEVRRPKVQPPPVPRPVTPKVMSTPRPAPTTTSPPREQRAPAPSKPAPLDPAKFPDMASYLNAVREQRGDTGNAEPAAQSRGPSEDEVRSANIQRNLEQSGTNGVFQIEQMDAHTATFSFRGWKNEYSYSHREVYQVDVGINSDIRRAVVRKMIEIIRRYYSGDFNWDSDRLGRVVVLSARLQDNDGLEDFMIQEFFGSHGVQQR